MHSPVGHLITESRVVFSCCTILKLLAAVSRVQSCCGRAQGLAGGLRSPTNSGVLNTA